MGFHVQLPLHESSINAKQVHQNLRVFELRHDAIDNVTNASTGHPLRHEKAHGESSLALGALLTSASSFILLAPFHVTMVPLQASLH